jgi:HD superfamily phosphodiesterase
VDGSSPETRSFIEPAAARELAELLLSELPRRLRHTLAVAATCAALADRARVTAHTREIALGAAYVHDIGYAPPLRRTGFHPLDGALYLRDHGWPLTARLVARHSQARLHAAARGLSLAEFPPVRGIAQDLLDYADATTGPDGQRMTIDERLAEIAARHGGDGPVGQVIGERHRLLMATQRRIAARLSTRLRGRPKDATLEMDRVARRRDVMRP